MNIFYRLAGVLFLFFRCYLINSAQTPQLVKDINAISESSVGYPLGNIGSTFLYVFNDGIHGKELWKSDGTAVGTVLVKDINVGSGSTFGNDPREGLGNNYAVVINNILYFIANDGINGWEIWKSDGTAAGTVLLKDINSNSYTSATPSYLTKVNSTLFFTADDNTNGRELWKSDGTTAGTILVKDINVGYGDAFDLSSLANVNGILYFVATNGTTGYDALWKSDGTTVGTVLVKDIDTAIAQYSYQKLDNLTNVNGVLYFSGYDNTNGRELWKSDGSTAGTTLVKDINVGIGDGIDVVYSSFVNVNGTLFLMANDGTTGFELWKSNGTSAGTILIKDINTGSSYASVGDNNFQVINTSTLLFTANDGINGMELWKSDGTSAGTILVKDVLTGSGNCCFFNNSWTSFVNTGTTIYFTGQDVSGNVELWKSDGTNANTQVLKDVNSGSTGSFPQIYNANGTIYFFADNGINGRELWKSDRTTVGTNLVKDVFLGTKSSIPVNIKYASNGISYFRADDGIHGFELWKTDGTAANTQLVKDIYGGSQTSSLDLANENIEFMNGFVYFRADDGLGGMGLWKSDGTTAGTILVKSFGTDFMDKTIINVNGTLFFYITAGWGYHELWKSDGTTGGTIKLKDVWVQDDDTDVQATYVAIGNILYFRAIDFNTGIKSLWKSDGTVAGTFLVKSFDVNSLYHFTNVNGTLFFVANDGTNGNEIWKSNGTTVGTVLVKDIYVGSTGSNPNELTSINGILYFTADDGIHGSEIWKTDGTAVNTNLIDIVSGYGSSNPSRLANVNGTLFFSANGSYTNGKELWKSDGTVVGTVMVKDVYAGTNSSNISKITAIRSIAYFVADDGPDYYELWKSDGTTIGTTLVQDLNAGTNLGVPYDNYFVGIGGHYLYNAGGTLYFMGDNGLSKFELWKIATANPCLQTLTLTSTIDDISSGIVIKQAAQINGVIVATNKITGNTTNVTYQANQINLNAGFNADNGTVFKVEIGGCN